MAKKKTVGGWRPAKPDYDVTATTDDGSHKGRIGAGWSQPDGSIAVKLSPFVVINSQDGLKIRLWPIEYGEDGGRKPFVPRGESEDEPGPSPF